MAVFVTFGAVQLYWFLADRTEILTISGVPAMLDWIACLMEYKRTLPVLPKGGCAKMRLNSLCLKLLPWRRTEFQGRPLPISVVV